MIKEHLAKVISGENLSREEAYETMKCIMSGDATDAQIAGYLIALRMAGETAEVIAGSAQAMREASTPVEAPVENVVDTCGTGGDGMHTFNISTAAAFVAAGAGVPVAKHGNKSVSSKCGSADVLSELGVNITVTTEKMTECLREIGIAFLFAPSLHPAMKYAIGPRKELATRTLFNVLGPLTNPAGAKRGVLGVYSSELVPMMAEAAASMGAQHLFVVHGNDGLDEITTTTCTRICEVREKKINTYEFSPEDAGIEKSNPDDLVGGNAEENAKTICAVLDGAGGAKSDIVLVNAAVAIVAGGKVENISDGVEIARESIRSGKARQKLNRLIEMTG